MSQKSKIVFDFFPTKIIVARKTKVMTSTITINTIASSEVLNRIETPVLLELHERINIAGLLTNSESWSLNKSDEEALGKLEIQAMKALFELPIHTPNPSIVQ